MKRAIYVASAFGFTEDGRRYLAEVVHPALWARGMAVLDPWTPPVEPSTGWRERVGDRNLRLIADSAAVLAFLEGQEIDAGTAGEVGYSAGIGRPVCAVRSDLRVHGEREGVVNLQIERFVVASGGTIVRSFTAALDWLAATP